MNKIILCALMIACLFTVTLTAQTQEEQSDLEVFVTASRMEEPAEDIPAYVSVITAEQLTASGQTTLVEALDGLAGIHFRSFSGNPAQAEVSMRGFGDNSFGRVLVLLDGRRLNRPDMASINWLEIPVESIERVEIVRGGSSVLYGDNAVAGVINVITSKDIPNRFSFSISSQYGSFNQNQERAEVNGSIGGLTVSVNAEHSSTDGFRDRSGYRSIGTGARLGLDLDRLSSSLMLSYSRLNYQLPGELTSAEFSADPTQAGNPSDESNNQYVNANLGVSYGGDTSWLLDGTLSYSMKLIQSDLPSNFVANYSDLVIHSTGFTPKLQIDSDILRGNRLLVGIDGYYDQLRLKVFTDEQRSATTDDYKIGRVAAGVYASDDLAVLPILTLNGAARYEFVYIGTRTLKTSGAAIDDELLNHSVVFDTSLLLKPVPNMRFWLSYGTVFRIPFTDEIMDLYQFGLAVPFNTDLKPEKGRGFEVGTDLTFMDLIKLSSNAFWLEMTDEIAYDALTNLNVNLDKTRHLGVEAAAALTIPSWFDLSGSYTYTIAKFQEGANQGNRIPLVPIHQASVEAMLHLPLGINAGATGRYVGDMYSGADFDNNLDKLEDYALLDIFLRYAPGYLPGDLELYLGVDNVLDTAYASTGFDYFTEVVYYPGTGRSWKVGGSYRY